MGYQNDLNIVRNCRKSLFHLTMLTSIVTAAALTTSVAGQDGSLLDKHRPAISYCDEKHERTVGRRLLYITTLDGRLSALDITKGGKVRWSVPTGPGPLISSSIHRLELTNNGQFVRMIPSLSGGIYKFDGESIDPIPITTENLLSSSTRFSDDLVISGGKETRTYGVCARTGQLLYECSMNGCVNATQAVEAATTPASDEDKTSNEGDYRLEHDPLLDDVILLRRQTQTVRAVESRTGVERWNFSVGQHELDVIKSSECHERQFSELDMAVLDLDVKVIVPEGLIYAFSKSEPNVLLWKYKFDHPIVSGWKTGPSDELESIDLFGSAQWVWDQDDNMFDPPFPSTSPSIYLGMYQKQLYIQESVTLRKEISDQSNLYTHLTTTESTLPKIPWRPIAASSNSLMIFHDDKVIAGGTLPPHHVEAPNTGIQGNELVPYDEDNFALTAQSVLNASEYVNGNGFYLYTDEELNRSEEEVLCDKQELPAIEAAASGDNITNHTLTDDLGFSLDDIDAPVKVVILSLWFWWKEIVVIAFTSAVLLNLFIGQRHHTEPEIYVIERQIPVPTAMEATESSTAALLGPTTNSFSKSNSNGLTNGHRSLSESTSHSGDLFSSRFQGDFDLVRCLGRGGFGVVFEAKNKLDDCKYAVKRITLPNKKESQRRVMREVKTLANCEHQNIVRFFQAWVESPPPGWQEEEDSKLLAHEMSTSIQIETPDGTTLPSFASSSATANPPKRRMQMDKRRQLMSWVESSIASTAYSSDQGGHNGLAEVEEDDDDDSCIVFRTESQSLAMKEEEEEDSGESKKNVISQRKSQYDAISIDIQSRSDKSQNGKSIDFSQLSDSFQIEFVRSANGEENGYDFGDDVDDKLPTHNGNGSTSVVKKRPLSLDLTNNNSCKALMEVAQSPPKPRPNKVYLYIQMQLCRKESLRDWLRDNKTEAREPHIGSIFHQIVDAVDYVHVKGLIHRDLKPSNIFFSQDGQIKIGDFGLVTDMCETPELDGNCDEANGNGAPTYGPHTQKVGTTLYMSPEQRLGKHYDCKVDIYSLGVIFFELMVYFSTEMERMTTLRNLRNDLYPKEFPADYPAEYELLQQMLATLPEGRPSTSELKLKLSSILKLPDGMGDGEDAALAAMARRFSRSRTFSSSEGT